VEIRLNGDTRSVRDGVSLIELLEDIGLAERRVAVELNRDVIPRGLFPTTTLSPGDVVEIVQLVGGG
jgi:thiamine biosynthesis protein ThiS